MQTKLVYVLTCAPEATYIEQALISIWSARYHNPDAHIVLLVDDLTNQLLVGKRAEVLEYITEKVVIPFEDVNATMMYRSRWIKTQVRQLVRGDFLFVDSDTIIQKSLVDVDEFNCEVGAVLESHLLVKDYCLGLYNSTKAETAIVGVDLDAEQQYYSSGVILVRDTEQTYLLYTLWHQYWKEGIVRGLTIDQPSLAKANREIGHIIKQIPDTYNCILFTKPIFIRDSHILHIAAYQNPSFLFTNKVLNYIRENGLGNEWLQNMILNPCATIMPFEYNIKYSTYKERKLWIKTLANAWIGYGDNIDSNYAGLSPYLRLKQRYVGLIKKGCAFFAIWLQLAEMRIRLVKKNVLPNYCQK